MPGSGPGYTIEDLVRQGRISDLFAILQQLLIGAPAPVVAKVMSVAQGADAVTLAAIVQVLQDIRPARPARPAPTGRPRFDQWSRRNLGEFIEPGYSPDGSVPDGAQLDATRAANRQRLGMGDAADGMGADDGSDSAAGLGLFDFSGAARDIFGQTVNKVTLKTSITPEMSYTPDSTGGPAQIQNQSGGPGEFLLKALQPDLEIQTPAGTVTMAPYGVPQSNYFWPFAIVATVVGGAGVYFIYKGVKATWRERRR